MWCYSIAGELSDPVLFTISASSAHLPSAPSAITNPQPYMLQTKFRAIPAHELHDWSSISSIPTSMMLSSGSSHSFFFFIPFFLSLVQLHSCLCNSIGKAQTVGHLFCSNSSLSIASHPPLSENGCWPLYFVPQVPWGQQHGLLFPWCISLFKAAITSTTDWAA